MNIKETLRFDSDKQFFEDLIADKTISVLADKRLSEVNQESYRRNLLGNSLRVSKKIAPKLYEFIKDAQVRLGLSDKTAEVYIYNSSEPNASCSYLGDDEIILTFSSGLLNSMNDDELRFVIGHEFGHALFEHYRLPTHGILDEGNLDANEAMKLMSWSRRAEISADRAGLFISKSPKAAISSFLKLSCGVSDPVIDFDLHEYSSQIQDLSELSNSLEDTSHCYSSHPFNPIRVMAVDLYSQSDEYNQLLGNDSSLSMSDINDIDKKINDILEYMEPTADEEKTQILNKALFWAGIWVAYADGEYHEDEQKNLIEQIGEDDYKSHMAELEEAGNGLSVIKEKLEKSVKPLLGTSASDRCSFLQKLVVIARADGNVHSTELDVLSEIAKLIKVDPAFIQQILMFLD